MLDARQPFEALGEAMQTVGCWLFAVCCKLVGHKWETMETYYPGAGTHYEGDFCKRCWKVDYYRPKMRSRTEGRH